MINDSQIEGALHNFTVQWNVGESLDGTTIAEGLIQEGGILVDQKGQQDEEGTFIIDNGGDAGIFDVDAFGKDGSYGERYLRWIRVESGAGALPPTFQIFIVFRHPTNGSYVRIQEITRSFVFAGDTVFYLGEIFHLPQGTAIQIVAPGLGPAPVGIPHRVKLSVVAGTSSLEDADLHRAMCCNSASEGGDVGPPGPAGPAGPEGPEGPPGPAGTSASLDFLSFSSQSLPIVSTNFGHYFTWSGSYDPIAPTDSSDAIIAVVAEEDLVTLPGAVKLSIRAGVITSLVIRTETPFIATFFVELSVGAGAYVRTVVAAAVVLAANTNINVPLAQVPFAANTRIRFGFTSTTNAAASNVNAELEIATPIV